MECAVSDRVSKNVRRRLLESLGAVEARKQTLIQELGKSMQLSQDQGEPHGHAQVAAAALVDMLIDGGRNLIERRIEDHAPLASQHRAQGIHGRHYSRFGDALVPVLRDVLGPTYPRSVASAWIDAFWAIVRAMQEGEETVAFGARAAVA